MCAACCKHVGTCERAGELADVLPVNELVNQRRLILIRKLQERGAHVAQTHASSRPTRIISELSESPGSSSGASTQWSLRTSLLRGEF